ncbi:MAG: S9 family peptidase, partial [Pseudomonadota bacterium]
MKRLLALATLAAGSLATASADDHLRLFLAEDVFELEWADEPQIAPNGERALYVRRSNDIMTDRTRSHVWLVNLDGTSHEPLLADDDTYQSPRWSPDG